MFRDLKAARPNTFAEQTAYDKWLDRTADREEARSDRFHGAANVIPASLWRVLYFIAAVIFTFVLGFADSGEPGDAQGGHMVAVMAVITATMRLSSSLSSPYRSS